MRCEASLSGHSDAVECVRWGGSGLVYTASRDRTIIVWAVGSKRGDGNGGSSGGTSAAVSGNKAKIVRVLSGHAHRINSLALNTDYACRTGAFDHTSARLDFSKGMEAAAAALQAAAKAGGEAAAAAAAAAKRDAAAARGKAMYKRACERYAQLCGGGKERLLSASDDFTLILWSPEESKKPVKRLTGHQQAVSLLHFAGGEDGGDGPYRARKEGRGGVAAGWDLSF